MDRRYALRLGQIVVFAIGLGAIALFTFHAVSSLVFSVLGLTPSGPDWNLALTLGGFLAVAGAAVGLHARLPQRLTGLISGGASLAVLCFYGFGQTSGQDVTWAVTGAVVGLFLGSGLGFWAAGRKGFLRAAIALASTLCAYGFAFGLGTWTLSAIDVQRWGAALVLGSLTFIYLWLTKQAVTWTYRQWRQLCN